MTQQDVLKRLKEAGYKNDQATFIRIVTGHTITYQKAKQTFMDGARKRLADSQFQ